MLNDLVQNEWRLSIGEKKKWFFFFIWIKWRIIVNIEFNGESHHSTSYRGIMKNGNVTESIHIMIIEMSFEFRILESPKNVYTWFMDSVFCKILTIQCKSGSMWRIFKKTGKFHRTHEMNRTADGANNGETEHSKRRTNKWK